VTRVGFLFQPVLRDGQIDMRNFEFVDEVDEAECGDAQRFHAGRVVSALDLRDSTPQQISIKVVTRGGQRIGRLSEEQSDRDCRYSASISSHNLRTHTLINESQHGVVAVPPFRRKQPSRAANSRVLKT
jgi:hypothetical protein